jgi:hypothetical protein
MATSMATSITTPRCYTHDNVSQYTWCVECAFYSGNIECDECGNTVCSNTKCATSYPHNEKGDWVICTSCTNQVLEKLKPYYYDENENENENENKKQSLTFDEVSALLSLLMMSGSI